MEKPKKTENWVLNALEPTAAGELRWSVGTWGPRAYLTTDAETAQLIATTPRLLEALINLVDDWERVHGNIPVDHEAKAAIAQAQGLNTVERGKQDKHALGQLLLWLQDNIDGESEISFDNNGEVDSTMVLDALTRKGITVD